MNAHESNASSDGISDKQKIDYLRERSCTRKRAFATEYYAHCFLAHLQRNNQGKGLEVYACKFCYDFHLGHPKVKNMINEKLNLQIENNFKYHAPKDGQAERYNSLRLMAKNLAHHINKTCPDSREKSLAITALEESIMWANSSIARNE